MKEILDRPVDILELSVRTSKCLKDVQIKTIRELIKYSESDFLKMRNFGRNNLKELQEALAEHKLLLAAEN